ncbi:MAG: NYN domain-containing protein [Clostridia bacterium]|nr:NYN domain-containing protein [Clostridia bacterium]
MKPRAGRPPRRVLIVDGYNIINAHPEFSGGSLSDARDRLLNALMDYAGYSGQQVILVFDAWMSDRMTRTEERHGAVTLVYTQKGEIADRYIERLCDDLAADIEYRRVEVRVASSDALEQTIVLGRGATRLSARELLYEMRAMRDEGIRHAAPARLIGRRSAIGDRLPEDVRRKLDEIKRNSIP